MALKTFKPITPSLRQLVIVDRHGLWKGKPVKALTVGKSESGGRTKGGKHWVTPWGFPTKGKKTRKNKRTERFIIASRHDRKKKQQ